MSTLPKSPFPECATYEVEVTTLSLQDLSNVFGGRAKSTLARDCKELGVNCSQGVDRDGAWTLYVYMAWYQWMMNRGNFRVQYQAYWDMCTPDHLKGPGVVCSIETADTTVRESFLSAIGKSYGDFEKTWSDEISKKKVNYQVTIDV